MANIIKADDGAASGTLTGTKEDVVLAYIPPPILPAQAP